MPWAAPGLARIARVEAPHRRACRWWPSAGSRSSGCREVFAAGADVAAVVTDIVAAADPEARRRDVAGAAAAA